MKFSQASDALLRQISCNGELYSLGFACNCGPYYDRLQIFASILSVLHDKRIHHLAYLHILHVENVCNVLGTQFMKCVSVLNANLKSPLE